MAIKVKVTPDASGAEELQQEETDPQSIQITLEMRKTLDGKIMILDHRDMDIIIDTAKKQIITFPKEAMSDEVYQTQNKYFNHLAEAGIVERDSIHAGNVFASIQGTYPDSDLNGVSPAQVVLLSTHKFIQEERPRFEQEEWLENEMEDYYVYPTPEDSTPLGQVPEKPQKGTINPANMWGRMSGYAYSE